MSITDQPQVLPSFKADKTEFEFYRDPERKDTLVLLENDNTEYFFVNPLEVPMKKFSGMRQMELFAMQFGAYGATQLLVYARGLEDAIEEAGGWLAEFAPGHLSDLKEEYEDALKEAREELGDDADEEDLEEKAREIAEADMTYTESGYLNSSEWWGGEAGGTLEAAAVYAARAMTAAQYNNYDMIPKLPLGKGQGDPVELNEEDILKLYADADLGLTQWDIDRIADAAEEADIDLTGFWLKRVS